MFPSLAYNDIHSSLRNLLHHCYQTSQIHTHHEWMFSKSSSYFFFHLFFSFFFHFFYIFLLLYQNLLQTHLLNNHLFLFFWIYLYITIHLFLVHLLIMYQINFQTLQITYHKIFSINVLRNRCLIYFHLLIHNSQKTTSSQ